MTDPAEDELLDDLARLLGAGGSAVARTTELEFRDVLAELSAVLDEQAGAADRAAADEDLLDSWSTSTAEARAAALLTLTWQARTSQTPADTAATIPGTYADELLVSARTYDGGEEGFLGAGFPALPLPGPAGRLVTRLAFNADDLLISLETALLLLVTVRARQR